MEKRYELAIKLCFIVEKLHLKGITHDYIKPENIIIDENDNLHLINATENSPGTAIIYMLPDITGLTRRQADMIALMRSLFMDEQFLIKQDPDPIYTRTQSDTAIFKLDDDNIRSLLSTKFLEDDNVTPFSSTKIKEKPSLSWRCIDLANILATNCTKPVRALTIVALEFEKLHLSATSYEFQYANIEHLKRYDKSSDDSLALKQALRIMSHRYSRFTKEHLLRDNPFFKSACTHADLNTAQLSQVFHEKTPSEISTYASLFHSYRTSTLRPKETEIAGALHELF